MSPSTDGQYRSERRIHQTKVLIWSDLTVAALDGLSECHSYDQTRQVLASLFMLDNSEHNLKDAVVLDLYFYTLQFAREQRFSPEKMSVFFSIMKRTFDTCTETPYGNLSSTFDYFKELLFCHSINQPPTCIELFTHEEVMKMSTYALNTFFRHFKLYKYVFTPSVRLDLTFNYVGVLPSPPQSQVDDSEKGSHVDDDMSAHTEDEADNTDVEKLTAQAELKRIVTELLTKEAKKVEVNIEQHLKAAVEALNARIDPFIDTGLKAAKGKKK